MLVNRLRPAVHGNDTHAGFLKKHKNGVICGLSSSGPGLDTLMDFMMA